MAFLDSLFGNANTKYANSLKPIINKINSLEVEISALNDEGIKTRDTRH